MAIEIVVVDLSIVLWLRFAEGIVCNEALNLLQVKPCFTREDSFKHWDLASNTWAIWVRLYSTIIIRH